MGQDGTSIAGGRQAAKQDAPSSPCAGPMLSVIVPVYNSTVELTQCLAALAASEYDDFEVIVVDDGSTEPVAPPVAERGFKYLRIDGPGGPARARNRGAAQAGGKFLVFVDADVCVNGDALARFAAAFAEQRVDAVIGSYDDNPADRHFVSQYKNLFHHYVHQRCDGRVTTFWSGCGAIERALFLRFGGFDEQRYRRPAIEDIELGTWLSAAGCRIILDRRIQGKHLKRWSLRGLLKTDIFDRGIPWTRLMLRAGAGVNNLNLRAGQRLSVALAYLALLSALAAFRWPAAGGAAAMLVLGVTLLNLDLYRYFAARLGWWFALRAAPLHWLYFWYCGFCAVAGWGLHHLSGEAGATPALPPIEPVKEPVKERAKGMESAQ